jgi:hypothetical protein
MARVFFEMGDQYDESKSNSIPAALDFLKMESLQ